MNPAESGWLASPAPAPEEATQSVATKRWRILSRPTLILGTGPSSMPLGTLEGTAADTSPLLDTLLVIQNTP